MNGSDVTERKRSFGIWPISVIVAFVGLWLRYLASTTVTSGFWHHIANELGMALIIAAAVTVLYEAYARRAYAFGTVQGVLRVIMGDLFDTRLWEEMKAELLERTAMRRAFNVELYLTRAADMPPHILVLRTVMSYRLTSLRRKQTEIEVLHFVDRFMTGLPSQLGLPRLSRITIGGQTLRGEHLGKRFQQRVDLNKYPDRVVPVTVEREELVYLPGAYNLLMSELTELESLVVVSAPEDVSVEVNVLFVEQRLTPLQGWSANRVLLPGHSIEFRFTT